MQLVLVALRAIHVISLWFCPSLFVSFDHSPGLLERALPPVADLYLAALSSLECVVLRSRVEAGMWTPSLPLRRHRSLVLQQRRDHVFLGDVQLDGLAPRRDLDVLDVALLGDHVSQRLRAGA